jgi:hypothetical protein
MDIDHNPNTFFLDTGFDSKVVTITHGDPEKGYYGGYLNSDPSMEFGAKVYDLMGYGYGGSRVARLSVYNGGEEIMTIVEGGYINTPKSQYQKDVAKEIIRGFPARTVRPDLPEMGSEFKRSVKRPARDAFREHANDQEGPRRRQFRHNAREAGRSR